MTDYRNLTDDKSQTKNELLEARMLKFASEVIRGVEARKTVLPMSVANQLVRSAASIGANYAEASNASSRLDFRNKIFIAKKEAGETRYWLDLCLILDSSVNWKVLRKEAHELLLILQTIINSLRAKSAK